ncbi:hypothetical protein IMG5_127460, partial [Ichthyophthirius multifiliis]
MACSQKYFQPRLEAKVIHYLSNGSGRDSYISRTNGGIFKGRPDDPKGFEIGTFGERRLYKTINNNLPAKHIHYHNDGTGRDNYVKIDEGGLSGFSWNRQNYIKSLRDYNRIRFAGENDFFSKTQFTRPNSGVQNNKIIKNKQMKTTFRLSQPKIKEDP